jgi:hypothetical protein
MLVYHNMYIVVGTLSHSQAKADSVKGRLKDRYDEAERARNSRSAEVRGVWKALLGYLVEATVTCTGPSCGGDERRLVLKKKACFLYPC